MLERFREKLSTEQLSERLTRIPHDMEKSMAISASKPKMTPNLPLWNQEVAEAQSQRALHATILVAKNRVRVKAVLALGLAGICLAGLTAQTRAIHGAARTETRSGVVGRVVDGDTVWLKALQGAQPVKVRIQGIDAPEICQLGGLASRNTLKRQLAGRQVVLYVHGHDDHGRVLATVMLEDEDVGEWMVSNGQAWSYRYRFGDGPYALQEAAARNGKRGIFASAAAENPRSFRDRHGSCY